MAVTPVMSSRDTTTKTSTTTDSTGTGSSAEDLMNNFMELLVAQMKNQDPTSPMDNNQLTSQLAQFNTAAGVQQLNSSLNNVGTLVTSMQQMNAADWVGRDILVAGDNPVSTSSNGNQSFAFSLDSDAAEVKVTLTDASGNATTATLKNVKAGVHQYTLDDISDFQPLDPRAQADTTFKVSFSAVDANGNAPSVTALKEAKVSGVSFTPAGAVLELGVSGTASLGDVYLIE